MSENVTEKISPKDLVGQYTQTLEPGHAGRPAAIFAAEDVLLLVFHNTDKTETGLKSALLVNGDEITTQDRNWHGKISKKEGKIVIRWDNRWEWKKNR